MRYDGHVARVAKDRTVDRIVVGRAEGKTPLGRLRLSMKGNIDMDLNTSGWDGMDGTHMGHCRCRSTVVNTMMNFWAS